MERYKKEYSSKWQNQYTEEFKDFICNDFLTGSLSRRQIEKKYKLGNSRLTYWLRERGYEFRQQKTVSLAIMSPSGNTLLKEDTSDIEKLKKELQEAKLLSDAYKRMIEIAEKEYKIEIRKKSATK